MARCFVIQPFDGDAFDRRFDEILLPAIQSAGLDPYRVDRDPRVDIPITKIQEEIRASDVCLADITLNNPNVWFELGFAIASLKDVCIICSRERERFPFDIQHRSIILYQSRSLSDFTDLQDKIVARLKAILEKQIQMGSLADSAIPADSDDDLSSYEHAAMISIVQNNLEPDRAVWPGTISVDMERAGFNRLATSIALRKLLKREYIEILKQFDQENNEEVSCYRVTEAGMSWLIANEDTLTMKVRRKRPKSSPLDDDIPF